MSSLTCVPTNWRGSLKATLPLALDGVKMMAQVKLLDTKGIRLALHLPPRSPCLELLLYP